MVQVTWLSSGVRPQPKMPNLTLPAWPEYPQTLTPRNKHNRLLPCRAAIPLDLLIVSLFLLTYPNRGRKPVLWLQALPSNADIQLAASLNLHTCCKMDVKFICTTSGLTCKGQTKCLFFSCHFFLSQIVAFAPWPCLVSFPLITNWPLFFSLNTLES